MVFSSSCFFLQAEVARRRRSSTPINPTGLCHQNSKEEMSVGAAGRDISTNRIIEYDATDSPITIETVEAWS